MICHTQNLSSGQAHITLSFLRNFPVDEKVDWGWMYSQTQLGFTTADCSALCEKHVDPVNAAICKLGKRSPAWCCQHEGVAGFNIPPIMGKDEADFLETYLDSDWIVREKDADIYEFLCINKPCPRNFRPFWCRMYPFVPILKSWDQSGFQISGMYQVNTVQCGLKWSDVKCYALLQVVWSHALRNGTVREFLYNFLLDDFSSRAYAIVQA